MSIYVYVYVGEKGMIKKNGEFLSSSITATSDSIIR